MSHSIDAKCEAKTRHISNHRSHKVGPLSKNVVVVCIQAAWSGVHFIACLRLFTFCRCLCLHDEGFTMSSAARAFRQTEPHSLVHC